MIKKTRPIVVNPHPSYIADQSDPKQQKFIWSYEITIVNDSEEIVQLLNRFWRITDWTGRIEEIRGPGVTGLQPIIKPNAEFAYKSYCQLNTPQGTMEGFYEMQNLEEEYFTI